MPFTAAQAFGILDRRPSSGCRYILMIAKAFSDLERLSLIGEEVSCAKVAEKLPTRRSPSYYKRLVVRASKREARIQSRYSKVTSRLDAVYKSNAEKREIESQAKARHQQISEARIVAKDKFIGELQAQVFELRDKLKKVQAELLKSRESASEQIQQLLTEKRSLIRKQKSSAPVVGEVVTSTSASHRQCDYLAEAQQTLREKAKRNAPGLVVYDRETLDFFGPSPVRAPKDSSPKENVSKSSSVRRLL